MSYRLDELGWHQFERLAQALLKTELGMGVEAWGGHSDLGRDAYCAGPLNYPDRTHWLIWTSRKHIPVHGLERMDLTERSRTAISAAATPVGASVLSELQRARMLYRHAKAKKLPTPVKQLIRRRARRVIDNKKFTPERLRRLIDDVAENGVEYAFDSQRFDMGTIMSTQGSTGCIHRIVTLSSNSCISSAYFSMYSGRRCGRILGWFSYSMSRSSMRCRNHQFRSSVVVTPGVMAVFEKPAAISPFAMPCTWRLRHS